MELQILDINNISKDTILQKANDTVSLVRDGKISAIDTKILCKAYIEYFKKIDSEIASEAIDEAETYDKTERTKYGVKFEISQTGERLDYEDDPVYKELKENLKNREELLKTAFKSKDTIFDSEGIEIPGVPVKLHSKQIIKINL